MSGNDSRPRTDAGPRAPVATDAPSRTRPREEIDEAFRWELSDIFRDWQAWEEACRRFESLVEAYAGLEGSLVEAGAEDEGAERLERVLRLADEAGILSYRLWFYPSLAYDQDQRDNAMNARRQEVQALLARWEEASSWFAPELLALDEEEVRRWIRERDELAPYRFQIEDLFRRREHVLSQEGEQILSYASRFNELPEDAYAALSTADMRHPVVELSDGAEVVVTYGKYRALLATRRQQVDRERVFTVFYEAFTESLNTYAALYAGVCQRDWFLATARRYESTVEAALDDDDIPTAVLEQLIEASRGGTTPLRRYHRLRAATLGLDDYHLYDSSIPLVDEELRFSWADARRLVIDSVRPLGSEYEGHVRRAFEERWIDVYENEGKRSGAYSAGVYGIHPYMLLNYNETLDDLFTLAHEMGHTVHTLLSHENQPFATARYTIFVAEVASTMAERLLLERLLEKTTDPGRRAVLLQHAIDSTLGTFYSQVIFAEWELEMHRRAESGEPITADIASAVYWRIIRQYYDEAVDLDELYRITWARIPHFFQSPYYVYQYATSFAASAQLFARLRTAADGGERASAVDDYLGLLRAGGDDYPLNQLARVGVDLTRPEPVTAVIGELDRLVDELEDALAAL